MTTAAIPLQKLPVTAAPAGSVATIEVMTNEIPGVVTEWITIAGPTRYQEASSRQEERVWLTLDGRGTFSSGGQTFSAYDESIARAPLGQAWLVEVPAGSTLRSIRFRKLLSEADRLEYPKFPENQKRLYFRRFSDCTPYREAIKSPKTTSRTLLPQDIVPRMAVGTVETTGADEVKRHQHPMLEQYFIGLQGNRCTVSADAEATLLPALAILHIPLGSMHGAKVRAGDKLYYVWVDFFTTQAGQEWLKMHKPVEESPAAAKP
ncbi:MAG: hypothetical protein WCH99_08355 [Verrucomicrobiota bacterium]